MKKTFRVVNYFWLLWVFVAACGLSLVAVSRAYSSLWYTGFSLWWLLLLWSTGSRHTSFRSCSSSLSSCGCQALEQALGIQTSVVQHVDSILVACGL